MKFFFILVGLLGQAVAVSAPDDNWVTKRGPTVRGLTCAAVLDQHEDYVDQVQGAAKVLGGRRTGPVRCSS